MRFSYVLFIALCIVACQEKKTKEEITFVEKLPIEKEDTILPSKTVLEEKDERGKPIWGYRFVLFGDFDGDQIQDTLTERYVDAETRQETNKFFENEDILAYQGGEMIDHETSSYMLSNNLNIDTFPHTSHLGVFYAETIGDIDGDGADEIGVVEHHADYSSMNSYHIYTYKKGWKRYYSFEVRDWEFPALPEYNTIYGMFGAMDKVVINDSTQNQAIEAGLKNYQRVKIISPNIIEFAAFDVGDCDMNYVYKAYEDSTIWVVPKFPIEDKKIVSIWTEYELYPKETVEMIQAQQDSIEVCDPASLFKQRIQFKKATSNNHLIQ
jgi:hypothetical protein